MYLVANSPMIIWTFESNMPSVRLINWLEQAAFPSTYIDLSNGYYFQQLQMPSIVEVPPDSTQPA